MAQVRSVSALHQLQFNMLGNELESLFMPSAIVIVEGESDATFLTKVVQLYIPDRRVAIVCAHGEGEVKNKLNFFREAFGDIASSLYRDRLFVVFDKRISSRLGRIEGQGVLKENLVILSKNGIEHFYPPELVAAAFACDVTELSRANLEGDPIDFHGLRYTKKDMGKFVADKLTAAHVLHAEIQNFIDRLARACK
jgi:hypothetical protein